MAKQNLVNSINNAFTVNTIPSIHSIANFTKSLISMNCRVCFTNDTLSNTISSNWVGPTRG